ncbi:MAG: 4Fe-4S dicluster domain-containing protein, partial [Planctomycetota bacterium]
AEEDQRADALLLIRAGFARVSERRGAGRQTVAYLGRGHAFGAEELADEFLHCRPRSLARSLHAVGYVDVLRLPRSLVRETILPTVPRADLEQLAAGLPARRAGDSNAGGAAADTAPEPPPRTVPLAPRTLDFLVDNRFVNGAEAMVIDLDRCTRCDDCVRACAATHGGNPRFVRQGPVHDHFQFANACMHCVDPVCMIGCPTGAIHRDAATGVVQINDPTCIGCGTCADSCPYDNIRMVDIRDASGAMLIDQTSGQPVAKATKCDLCVDQHGGPACQNACPHDALVRIDVSQVTPLQNWIATDPSSTTDPAA